MFERLDPLGIWLWLAAGQATFWLAFGLFASRRYAHRPARAHGLLLLAAGAAPLTPLLSGLAQLLGWGLLVGPEPACSFRVLQPQPAETPAWWLHLESPAWLLPRALLLGWAGISAWLVLRLVASLRAGGRCFGGGAPVDEPALTDSFREAARAVGLTRLPALVRCPTARSPLVWSWGGLPRVVLPDGPMPARLDWGAVLRHELGHVRRRDAWAALLAEVLVSGFFWNPLAWEVRRRLLLAAEFACDDWALAGGASAADYAEALLQLRPAGPARPGVLTATGYLSTRIRRLLRHRRVVAPEVGRARLAVGVGLMLVLATCMAMLNARPGRATHATPIVPETLSLARHAAR